MTELHTRPFTAAPAPIRPPSVTHFFRPSSPSGRDSPRTIVAEELFRLHIDTPPLSIQDRDSSLIELPRPTKINKHHGEESEGSTQPVTPPPTQHEALFGTCPPKRRRSPRRLAPVILSPLTESVSQEMDIGEGTQVPSSRPRSPPPPEISVDSEEDDEICPADDLTRYLRRRKRMEQISAYRVRELRDDRESRLARRNNPLSPKSTKVTKLSVKKVKFSV